MKKLLFSALIFFTSISWAASEHVSSVWRSSKNVDKFTQDTRFMANGWSEIQYRLPESNQSEYTLNPLRQFGTRCDVSRDGQRKFMLTFIIEKSIAALHDTVSLIIKVDEHKPLVFTSHLFPNTDHAGYVLLDRNSVQQVHRFIIQAKAGYKMSIRVQNKQKSVIEDYSVPLHGFTKHTQQALRACAVSVSPSKLTAYDRRRIQEINQRIEDLESEKNAIMNKY